MAFCSFTSDQPGETYIKLEKKFVTHFLPQADGDGVRAYLYGLYLCAEGADVSAEEAAATLHLSLERLTELYRYWEDFDLVTVLSADPLIVRYLSVEDALRSPRRFRDDKYADFSKTFQAMRLQYGAKKDVSHTELSKLFAVMDEHNFSTNAMLMISRFSFSRADVDKAVNYIVKVAHSYAQQGITSDAKVQKKLETFDLQMEEIVNILKALGQTRKAEPADGELLKKWKKELGYEYDAILFTAGQIKRSSMEKLDETMLELYANKKFTVEEIENYLSRRKAVYSLTYSVANRLGVFCQNAEPYVRNYTAVWLAEGFTDETLLQLAEFCFKSGKKSFESMHEYVEELYRDGVVSVDSIVDRLRREREDTRFLRSVLHATGLSRNPNDWDKRNLATWRSWNFSDDMILKAAERASGRNSPVPYMNATLSAWKSHNVFSPEALAAEEAAFSQERQQKQASQSERPAYGKTSNFMEYDMRHNYKAEDLEAIIREMQEEEEV